MLKKDKFNEFSVHFEFVDKILHHKRRVTDKKARESFKKPRAAKAQSGSADKTAALRHSSQRLIRAVIRINPRRSLSVTTIHHHFVLT